MDYTFEEEREFFLKIYQKLRLLFIPSEMNSFSPKFLQSKILLWFVVCIFVLKIVSVVIVTFPNNLFFADINKAVLNSLVNQERKESGLKTLTENEQLDQAAMLKAKDIMEKDYFAHNTPDGKTPWYFFTKIGYNYKYAGENLAIGFLNSEDVYKAWYDSLSHRDNILSPYYNEIGTAILTDDFKGSKTTVVVQLFGTQKKTATTAVKPTPKPTVTETTQPAPVVEQTKPVVEQTKTPKTEVVRVIRNGQVLSQSTGIQMSRAAVLYYRAINFMVYNSEDIFKFIAYACLIIIGASLLLNILIHFNIQNTGLILRSLLLIGLLSATLLINKDIVHFIPHKITI